VPLRRSAAREQLAPACNPMRRGRSGRRRRAGRARTRAPGASRYNTLTSSSPNAAASPSAPSASPAASSCGDGTHAHAAARTRVSVSACGLARATPPPHRPSGSVPRRGCARARLHVPKVRADIVGVRPQLQRDQVAHGGACSACAARNGGGDAAAARGRRAQAARRGGRAADAQAPAAAAAREVRARGRVRRAALRDGVPCARVATSALHVSTTLGGLYGVRSWLKSCQLQKSVVL
jgi:hypothetical protein